MSVAEEGTKDEEDEEEANDKGAVGDEDEGIMNDRNLVFSRRRCFARFTTIRQ